MKKIWKFRYEPFLKYLSWNWPPFPGNCVKMFKFRKPKTLVERGVVRSIFAQFFSPDWNLKRKEKFKNWTFLGLQRTRKNMYCIHIREITRFGFRRFLLFGFRFFFKHLEAFMCTMYIVIFSPFFISVCSLSPYSCFSFSLQTALFVSFTPFSCTFRGIFKLS